MKLRRLVSRLIILTLLSSLGFAHGFNCGQAIERIFIAELAQKSGFDLPTNTAVKSLKVLDETVEQKDIDIITAIIRQINQGILQHSKVVQQVDKINLQVQKTDSNAFFMGFGQHILYSVRQMAIPAREADGSIRVVLEHPIKTEPVTAHEFGHAVVNKTMYTLVPEYRQFVDALKPVVVKQLELEEMVTVGRPLQEEFQKLLKKHFPDKKMEELDIEDIIDIPELVEAFDKWDAFLKVFMQAQNELRDLNQKAMKEAGPWQGVQAAFGAHNEFFADVIGVAYTKSDPEAISDALANVRHYQLESDKAEISAMHRNFEHRDNRIDRWKENPQIHGRFAPTRYHVFHNYMKQPMNTHPEIQAQILDNIMRAIIKDMQWRIKHGGVGRSPREDNRELIKLIDEMFVENPIDYSMIDRPML